MAFKITDDCNSCGACEPECPNHAISEGADYYVIDPDKCTECVGAGEEPKCVAACPTEGSIIPDPDRRESREELEAKFARLH